MSNNHDNFSSNVAAFSDLRNNQSAQNIGLGNQFSQAMNQTMNDLMPKWPSTINSGQGGQPPAPGMAPPAPGAQPPIPGAPAALLFNIVINGQSHGPYDINTLAQFKAQGHFNEQCMVWRQGMTTWQAAGSIPELVPLFSAPDAAPPIPPPMPPAQDQ